MAGLGKAMPFTMAAFVLAGFSLIGIPSTVGFVSKWHLILASIEQEMWLIAVLIVVASLLAIIYLWKVIEVAYFTERSDDAISVQEAPVTMLLPMWVLVGANVYFGVNTDLTVSTAFGAAKALIGVGP